jgi:hypothetical protein
MGFCTHDYFNFMFTGRTKSFYGIIRYDFLLLLGSSYFLLFKKQWDHLLGMKKIIYIAWSKFFTGLIGLQGLSTK